MSNKRFCGLINTPKTATNDEKHFFGSQNTPLFDIPTFNFQPTSEEQLSKQQSFAAKDVDFLKGNNHVFLLMFILTRSAVFNSNMVFE